MQTAAGFRLRIQSGDVGGLLTLLEARSSITTGSVLLLTGSPGIGKSTTIDALLRGLGPRMARAFRVSADEPSRRQPFGLISSLVGLVPQYPPRPDAGDRVLAAVEDLCGVGQLVLCADDLHHADGDSLRVLTQLVESTRDLPLTLILARRPLPVRDQLVSLAARPKVLAAEVVPMDRAGLADLVRRAWGTAADASLLDQLAVTGGNPFHAGALLEQFRRTGPAAGRAETERDPSDPAVRTIEVAIRSQLALLDAPARDLLQILAVWGRPADVLDLAAIAGTPTGTTLRAVQAAVDSSIAGWTTDEHLGFSHDLYAEVIMADLAPGLRRLLHAACAQRLGSTGGMATEIAGHEGDADSAGLGVESAIRIATTDLVFAPEQAADLLAGVTAVPGSIQDGALAIARAGALAAAGRMGESKQVAMDALVTVRDVPTRRTLTRLLLHTTVSDADTVTALQHVDDALLDPTLIGGAANEPAAAPREGAAGTESTPIDPAADFRHALIHLRRWVLVLDGSEPVPPHPDAGPVRSGAALVPTAIQLFQRARCVEALAMVQEAQRARLARGDPVWGDGVTAPVWPAWFGLFARGPEAASAMSVEARREAQQQGRGWLWPYHLSIAGTIDSFAGRWDDASAVFAESADAASGTGTGWVSRGVGGQLVILVQRGQLEEAAALWTAWQRSGRRNEQGLPYSTLGGMLLAESTGRLSEAVGLAAQVWSRPHVMGRLLWALLAAPDVLRVARAAGAFDLADQVVDDVSTIPTDQVPTLAGVVPLIRAVAAGDSALAARAASISKHAGHVSGELYAWEEAAVASAAAGDRDLARTWARRALDLADVLGARTVERRLAARLRDHRVRLGATGSRKRPSTGWASLTPTELRVAEQVAAGLTSPQIATQLYLSPRTVQTHITHILRKLQLRSRVELATAWTGRR